VIFCEILISYIDLIGCASKELASASGLSVAQISKYKNGKRIPREGSEQLTALSRGLYQLAKKKGIDITEDEILSRLTNATRKRNDSNEVFSENFRSLITELKINTSDLSSFMNYDPSFISKIKNGDRNPSNFNEFSSYVGRFVSKRFNHPDGRSQLVSLLGGNAEQYRDEEFIKKAVSDYLLNEQKPTTEIIESFLTSLNKTVVSSDNQTSSKYIPSIPKTLNRTKLYSGLSGMKAAESDFFLQTILSSSKKTVFIHSDMGMNEVDESQKSKLQSAVEMLIAKGIRLTLIHNINRPIDEMLMGLEVWLPLYMTGMVSSFYFDEPLSSDFPQILCTSGVAAMQGECIASNQDASSFVMTTNRNYLDYFFKKRDYMLSRAIPLIKFYGKDNEKDFDAFVKIDSKNTEIYEISKEEFPNISFTVNKDKWISINRTVSDPLHFVVFNKKLIDSIEVFLKG